MLRTLRTQDLPELPPLLQRNFPEEEALLGTNPEEFLKVARRVLRWDARFVLGLMNLFGRPVFRFLIVEADGRPVGTTLVTFSSGPSAYLSMVMVDGPYRRHGLARDLLHEAAARAKALRRRFVMLDVLDVNAPARRLYESEGYQLLTELTYRQRPLEASEPIPEVGPIPGLRPVQSSDGARLAELANASLSATAREVAPHHPQDFDVAPRVVRSLQGESEGYVIDDGNGPIAFLRASASQVFESGHLTAPVLAPEVDDERAARLVRRAVGFLRAHGSKRALVQVPIQSTRAVRVLESEGFHEAFKVLTLYRPLGS